MRCLSTVAVLALGGEDWLEASNRQGNGSRRRPRPEPCLHQNCPLAGIPRAATSLNVKPKPQESELTAFVVCCVFGVEEYCRCSVPLSRSLRPRSEHQTREELDLRDQGTSVRRKPNPSFLVQELPPELHPLEFLASTQIISLDHV